MKRLCFFLPLILLACKSSVKSANEPLLLDFDMAVASASDILLSTIADSIEYIPLETNDSCLIGRMPRFYVYNDYIIADNGGDPPCVFDRRGKFLNRIGRIGKGPGEFYLGHSSLHYNPVKSCVTLYFYNWVMLFDIDGTFWRQDTLPKVQYGWEKGGTDRYTAILACGPDSSRIYMADRMAGTCRLLPGGYPTLPVRDKQGKIYSYIYGIYYKDDYVIYYSVSDQRFYRFYYDGRVANPYRIKLSMKDHNGRNIRLLPIIDISEYLFTSIYAGSLVFQLIYLKERDELLCMNCSERGLINDIDSGFDFYPNNISSDGRLYMSRSAREVKEMAAKSINPELRALAGRLNDDDNPVLMLVSLK